MNLSKIFVIILIALLITTSLVQAQELKKYSFFGRLIDGFRLFFSYGESRVDLLLEIKEKEVNSAIVSAGEGKINEAARNLENAKNNLNSVQELINLDNTQKIVSSVNKTINQLTNKTLPKEFNDYVVEERVTGLNAELINKTYQYCKELALEDYYLMLEDESCNPATAMINIKEELRALEQLQAESFNKLMLEIRSCINDPGTCDCTHLSGSERAKCEEMTSLALKCEYQEDNESCNKLESMQLNPESFVPSQLSNLYQNKSYMIDYNIEKSDVPPECYNENNKSECEQYRGFKEINGQQGTIQNREPTIQESIPQCYDSQGNFKESCGKVIKVMNSEGLINYLIEGELNKTINSLTNNTIDVKGLINQTKQELIDLNNTIITRVFAPGTWETNNSDTFIEGNQTNGLIVIEGNDTGDLMPDVSGVVVVED